jgi:2-iminobutanoate/2-iminopropanoate deaminase
MSSETSRKKEVFTTGNAPMPGGTYSQAIRYGDLLFLSGVVPADKDAETFTILHRGDLEKQTRLVLDHIRAIVEDAGSSLDNILKMTVFIDELNDFFVFDSIYKEYFAGNPPARSTVEVSKFLWGMRIEIECIAAVPHA